MHADATADASALAMTATRRTVVRQTSVVTILGKPLLAYRLALRSQRFGKRMQVVIQQFMNDRIAGLLGGAALRAHPSHQTLRQYRQQRVGKIEGVHAHVDQAGDGLGSAVRMQSRQYQMPGQRRFNGNLGRFLVADLAHHDDVRVGPQEGSQGLGKSPVNLGIHLDLTQIGLRYFDRILSSPDLALRRV